jgi:hypothetical protein
MNDISGVGLRLVVIITDYEPPILLWIENSELGVPKQDI